MEHLDVLRAGIDGENSLRDGYNYLIDYLYEYRCFLDKSGQRCMFESYGTIIDFEALLVAWEGLSESQKIRSLEILREVVFTPLALVIGTFLEKRV